MGEWTSRRREEQYSDENQEGLRKRAGFQLQKFECGVSSPRRAGLRFQDTLFCMALGKRVSHHVSRSPRLVSEAVGGATAWPIRTAVCTERTAEQEESRNNVGTVGVYTVQQQPRNRCQCIHPLVPSRKASLKSRKNNIRTSRNAACTELGVDGLLRSFLIMEPIIFHYELWNIRLQSVREELLCRLPLDVVSSTPPQCGPKGLGGAGHCPSDKLRDVFLGRYSGGLGSKWLFFSILAAYVLMLTESQRDADITLIRHVALASPPVSLPFVDSSKA
ncbi:Map3K12-Binding Inhibitory Protein 1 [Manis pentadactyla]|nr:Map3K12-Binding Inhibitory Protein 1 [Manis pentadactyla]